MSASLFASESYEAFKNAQDVLHRGFSKNAVTGADTYLGSTNEIC